MKRIVIPPRQTYAEIDLDAFNWNFKQVQKRVNPSKVAAVVKANAYGHGLIEISQEAIQLGAIYLCVALVQEGLALRQAGIDIPILLMLPVPHWELEMAVAENLELSINSYEEACAIADSAQRLHKDALVHIYVDTGMHRMGVQWDCADDVIQRISNLPGIRINGIYTHFSSADSSDLRCTIKELERFKSVLSRVRFSIPFVHTSNSAALVNVKESCFTMVRPGFALYGFNSADDEWYKDLQLKPVLSFKSYVAEVQTYKAYERFGYSQTYMIPESRRIAAVPAGYADGIDRRFSNFGEVLINGDRFSIVGIVSMDTVLVDIGNDNSIRPGDEVVFIGKQRNDEITLQDWCKKLQTIPYEITCSISSRVERRFWKNGALLQR